MSFRSKSILTAACLALAFGWAALSAEPASMANSNSKASVRRDKNTVRVRGDVRKLPKPLKNRLIELAGRPHTFLPLTVFSEAPTPSQAVSYYLLDTTGFQPNVFTAIFAGVNDHTAPTAANFANHQLPTIGAVRVVLEPKPGLPTDPNDPGSFNDVFTDVSGLFVINNESGWYEGWMLHDMVVPQVAPPRSDGSGHAQFGMMTADDAAAIAAMGTGNNAPGKLFTMDGNAPRFPSTDDVFPSKQSNLVPIFLSMGAWNSLQQSDAHAYWEFNQYTDWVFPSYELAFTGGEMVNSTDVVTGAVSLVPGPGPSGKPNNPQTFGDTANKPRDPDRILDTSPTDPDLPATEDNSQKETRLRFIPSGLGNEVMLDVFVRVKSFEPNVTNKEQRLFDAYAAEVARVDQNGDGVISAVEADLESTSDNLSNDRLFIPVTQFNRFAVTREINDGLLAPRFAPSQRAWVLRGDLVLIKPTVNASIPQDADNR